MKDIIQIYGIVFSLLIGLAIASVVACCCIVWMLEAVVASGPDYYQRDYYRVHPRPIFHTVP